MFDERKKCANCSYWHPEHQACVLLRAGRAEDDFCSSHTNSPPVCATCQSYIIGKSFYYQANGQWIEVCENCAHIIPTCAGCKNSVCEFEENPDPMPKMVMRTIQQENAVIQASMRNPEREQKFCPSCPCWDKNDNACNREFNVCGNHHCIFDP